MYTETVLITYLLIYLLTYLFTHLLMLVYIVRDRAVFKVEGFTGSTLPPRNAHPPYPPTFFTLL